MDPLYRRILLISKTTKTLFKRRDIFEKYRNGNYDQWDYRAHEPFIKILAELESRRKIFEE